MPSQRTGDSQPYNGYVQTVPFQGHILPEIRFAIICADCIGSQERDFHRLDHTVINLMARFYIMIAHYHGVITNIFSHTRENMPGSGVNIIEIICGIISLQAVTRINEYHIINALGRTKAVSIPSDIGQCIVSSSRYVERVEVASMHIICSKKTECIFSVPRAAARSK